METIRSFIFSYGYIYLIAISLVSITFTIHDKLSAIRHKRRVPEKTLLTISLLGGSVAMLVTMLIIRHKTKHPKFMIGIPVIIILQLAILFFFFYIK